MGRRVNLVELAEDTVDEVESSQPSAPLPSSTRTVPVATLALNPLNKREHGEDEALDELADTLSEHGVIQPLVVCSAPSYAAEFPEQKEHLGQAEWVVLIGNRRLLAARRALLEVVDIVVNDEQVTSMYEVMLVENTQRRELSPLREAEAMREALNKSGVSRRELARRIGKSHVYVAQRLALMGLIPELQRALEAGELKVELAREFGDLSTTEQYEIAAGGKPFRRQTGNAVTSRSSGPRIRAATPAIAAESIRQRFSAAELSELIRLLTDDGSTTQG